MSQTRPSRTSPGCAPEDRETRPEDAASAPARSDAIAGRASPAIARRVIVAVIGGTLVAIGAVLLVVPGPGLLAISVGLGVLALEFAWARRWLRRLKREVAQVNPFDAKPPQR